MDTMPAKLEDMDLDFMIETARKHEACLPALRELARYKDMPDLIARAPVAYRTRWAVWYAERVMKTRWVEAEPYILEDGYAAATYAIHVMQVRWPEAESVIMKGADAACLYARCVLKARWPEAESVIMKGADAAYPYRRAFGLNQRNRRGK